MDSLKSFQKGQAESKHMTQSKILKNIEIYIYSVLILSEKYFDNIFFGDFMEILQVKICNQEYRIVKTLDFFDLIFF